MRVYLLITVGVLLLALANDLFLIPNDVFSGGATGIALVVSSFITNLDPTQEIRGYLILFPGLMILLSINIFIGDALRDVLDLRMKT